ncbi:MAG: GAF domain-containing protein [Thermostichales cyanobacterium SRBZ-1_bins_19]
MVAAYSDKPLVGLQVVLQKMRLERDPRVLTGLALDYLKSIFAAPLIWLALYDPVSHSLVGQGGVTTQEDTGVLQSTQPLQPGEFLEQVVIEQRPLGVPDMSREPRMGIWQREAKRLDIQGCLMYPIRHPQRCMGVLLLGSQLWGVTSNEEEQALVMVLLEQLGASLYEIEQSWKQAAQRRLEEPLLLLATAMRSMTTMEERVAAVVSQLQVFTGVNRVQVYWLDREKAMFVQRWTSLPVTAQPLRPNPPMGKKHTQPKVVSFPSRELGDLYYSLVDGQTIAVSEPGAVRSEIPLKLMQRLRAHSMMVAPLLLEGDLYGFLSVESEQAHPWLEEDRALMTGCAALLSLSIPVAERELALEQLHKDQGSLLRLAKATYSEEGLTKAIQQAAELLVERLGATACVMLLYEPATQTFALAHEHRKEGKKNFPRRLRPLGDQDWQDLLQSQDALATDNYQQDLRFGSWRQELTEVGAKALMVSHTSHNPEQGVEGLVLVLHQSLRYWNRDERQLLRSVALQLGLVMRQWQLQQSEQRQAQLISDLSMAVMHLQAVHTLPELFQQTAQQLATVLKAPLAVVVTCWPGETKATVVASQALSPDFALSGLTEFEGSQDPLLYHCLQEGQTLEVAVADLPASSAVWLNAAGIGQLLVAPLGYSPAAALAPLGMVVVADGVERLWAPTDHLALEVLSSTAGTGIRRVKWTQKLQEQRETLTELNWYKQRRLLDTQALIVDNLRRLGQVADPSQPEATRRQKIAEIGQSFRDLVPVLQQILKQEAWTVTLSSEDIPIAAVIRRTLQRLEALIQKRKLWPRIQGEPALSAVGDPGRLEMVFYEVLLHGIQRSQEGSSLEIWVQPSHGYVELMVVDTGYFDPQLLAALAEDPQLAIYADPDLSSPLTVSPGLELSLCQRLLLRMNGELIFYQVPDGRNVSRLVLPMGEVELPAP